MERSASAIIKDLERLASTRGYMHVLAGMASSDLFMDSRKIAAINWRERISYQELTLMVGLALKSDVISYDNLSESQVNKATLYTRALLGELHQSYNNVFRQSLNEVISGSQNDRPDLQKTLGNGPSMVEATFYSDSGAYDFQYLDMAPRLYAFDGDWIANVGLDFSKAKVIYKALNTLSEVMHDAYLHPAKVSGLRAIDQFAFHRDMIMDAIGKVDQTGAVSSDDLDKFLSLFSSKPDEQNPDFSGPGTLNIVNVKPMLEIAEDVYFVPVNFNLAEAIYQSPAYWMRRDDSYVEKAAENRGLANEQITYEYFKAIFGKTAFKRLKVVKGKKVVTDIDVMGVVGSVAVIAQNKSKRMTLRALEGDEEILKSDFKLAIQSAYEQGIQSRKVLLEKDGYKFIDEKGEEVALPHGIEEVYILCVTSDVYPASLHQMRIFLEKEEADPWPLPVSLFDLAIIAEYLSDPYEFTYYLRQRVLLAEKVYASNEMALLGYHLKRGLSVPANSDFCLVDQGYAQFIDADYMYRKGRSQKPSKKHSLSNVWSNKEYERILQELKEGIDNPKLTDIVFFLKDVPPHLMDTMVEMIKRIRYKASKDGLAHNFSIPILEGEESWGGVSYILGHSESDIRSRMERIVTVNKYKYRSKRWLGIGALIGGSRTVDAVSLSREPWEWSDEMDQLVQYHNANAKGYELTLKALQKTMESRVVKKHNDTRRKKDKRKRKLKKKARRLNR